MKHITQMQQAIEEERRDTVLGIVSVAVISTSPLWGKILAALLIGFPVSQIVW